MTRKKQQVATQPHTRDTPEKQQAIADALAVLQRLGISKALVDMRGTGWWIIPVAKGDPAFHMQMANVPALP